MQRFNPTEVVLDKSYRCSIPIVRVAVKVRGGRGTTRLHSLHFTTHGGAAAAASHAPPPASHVPPPSTPVGSNS